jgi:hypothetical protein
MDQFAFTGFSASNTVMCMVDGEDVFQVDYVGGKRLIGKTTAAYNDLQATTQQYYDKLVELGVIVPQKAPEVMMAEMQGTMLEMSKIISGLSAELKELKEHGHGQCACDGGEDVPRRQPKRSGAKSATGDCGDAEQP